MVTTILCEREGNVVWRSWTVNSEMRRGQSCLWRSFRFLDEY